VGFPAYFETTSSMERTKGIVKRDFLKKSLPYQNGYVQQGVQTHHIASVKYTAKLSSWRV